jgi:hypothetical protein
MIIGRQAQNPVAGQTLDLAPDRAGHAGLE